MIVLQLPSALSVDNRDYSNDRPRTLQNDSLLRRSILFLRMLIEEIKIATRQRYMEERKARVEVTRELPEAAARRKSQNGPYRSGRAVAISPANLAEATRSLQEVAGIQEALILSTCNRVELLTRQDADSPRVFELIGEFIENYSHVDP